MYLKVWYESTNYSNDTLSVNVMEKGDHVPLDGFNIPCRGSDHKVRGYWGKPFPEAIEYAKQVMDVQDLEVK